jgi:hypothetical protein
MSAQKLDLLLVSLVVTLPLTVRADGQIEPNAGK